MAAPAIPTSNEKKRGGGVEVTSVVLPLFSVGEVTRPSKRGFGNYRSRGAVSNACGH